MEGFDLLERVGDALGPVAAWRARLRGSGPDAPAVLVRAFPLRVSDESLSAVELGPEVERLLPRAGTDAALGGRGLVPGRLQLRDGAALFVRPWLPARLADVFPPAPRGPPPAALLGAMADVAAGLDVLAACSTVPMLVHGNLLWTGTGGALVDHGLELLVRLYEEVHAGPRQGSIAGVIPAWADLQPLDAPSSNGGSRAPGVRFAAAWFALRTGHALFAPPPPSAGRSPTLEDLFEAHRRARAFLDAGALPVDELADEGERALVCDAIRGQGRLESAEAVAAALRALLAGGAPAIAGRWKIVGYDTFAGESYAIGTAPTREAALAAAQEALAQLEQEQPAARSGGQADGGIQDRVHVVSPEGHRERVLLARRRA